MGVDDEEQHDDIIDPEGGETPHTTPTGTEEETRQLIQDVHYQLPHTYISVDAEEQGFRRFTSPTLVVLFSLAGIVFYFVYQR